MSAGLELRGISIDLRGATLVPALSCTVAPGEIVTVMGPSGSGKSTLLAFIGGFLDPAFTAKGEVLVSDRAVTRLPAEKRRVGILFQDDLCDFYPKCDG